MRLAAVRLLLCSFIGPDSIGLMTLSSDTARRAELGGACVVVELSWQEAHWFL
jgi:hypothetical protein